jgi:tripartite-type tricarboxylate transporter receptor subunit TctC
MMMRIRVMTIAGAIAGAFAALAANAQTRADVGAGNYPARPIRFICPLAPGGSVDIASRAVAQKLSESLGQQVVVDNRSGGGGNIGAEIASKAPPDGYTMVMGSSSTFAVNPTLYRNLKYDAIKDFSPVSMVSFAPNVLVVHPTVPASSVKELVALAKAKPGQLAFASSGTGGAPHLAGELFKMVAGVDIIHVPYRGTGQAVADLLAGQVPMSFGTALALLQHIKAAKLRALAVTSHRRIAALPEVPTMAEAGLPGVEVTSWNGVLVPAGTPSAIVAKLNREMVRILNSTEMKERMASQGAEAAGNTPEEFGAFIKSEIAKWGKVVKAAGLRAD